MSHKYKFIFIHIYKTAGTSIMGEFVPYSRLIDRLAYDFWFSRKTYGVILRLMGWQDDGMKQFTGFHKHATAYEIKKKIGDNTFDSYYKFSFVRNPFDFLVSLYFYILQAKEHIMHKDVSMMDYSEFLKWYLSQNPPHQIDFLMNPNRDQRLVDYIGRFETFENDVNIVKNHLNLSISRDIKHMNPSIKRKSKNYKDYYDTNSRDLVLSYFQSDFENLGYDFSGFQETIPLMQQF